MDYISQLLLLAASEKKDNYWLTILGGTGLDQATGVDFDGQGNVYIGGITSSSGSLGGGGLVAKYTDEGQLTWQRVLSGCSTEDIAVDNTGNVYAAGRTTNVNGTIYLDTYITFKYDTNGILQFQRGIGDTGNDGARGIAIDDTGNIYVTGVSQIRPTFSRSLFTIKYNAMGALQWQRGLVDPTTILSGRSAAVDGFGNLYVTGQDFFSGAAIIAKYNPNGAILWNKKLTGNEGEAANGITVDSGGGVYIVGSAQQETGCLIAKYNTNGVLLWQRILGGSGTKIGTSITVDDGGNVYICGLTAVGGQNTSCLIAKYNTNGALLWQRTLGGSGDDIGLGIKVDNKGNVYICGGIGFTAQNGNCFLVKLPADSPPLSWSGGGVQLLESNLVSSPSTLLSADAFLPNQTPNNVILSPSLPSSISNLTNTNFRV